MAEASLTSLEMTAIGAVSGTVEVCIMQPTVGVKNAIQEGRPIPRNPAGLYRGLLVRLPMLIYTGQAVCDTETGASGRAWLSLLQQSHTEWITTGTHA